MVLKNHDFIHVNSTVAGKYNKQDDGHLRFPIRTKSLRYFQYKCTWPIQKHGEANLTLEVKMSSLNNHFSNFGRSPSPIIHAKIRAQAYLVLEKKIFEGFYHIWAWQPF